MWRAARRSGTSRRGPSSNNVFTATLDKYVNGQCVSCTYKSPALLWQRRHDHDHVHVADHRHRRPPRRTAYPGWSASSNPPPRPVPSSRDGGVWWNKNESGSGLGLDYGNGTLIAEVYSYVAGGRVAVVPRGGDRRHQ